ncbi:MAG: hypothetical protein LBN27_01215 [Prevotellaceae bacterium]|nr:hypothetical protein [Prevotellaceae bacterium]
MKKLLLLLLLPLLAVSCKDEYHTDQFTGKYSYDETGSIRQIQRGEVLQEYTQTRHGDLRISGTNGKITATFTSSTGRVEKHEYITSGSEFRANYTSDIQMEDVIFSGVNVREIGFKDADTIFIKILLDGVYESGLNKGFIEGERYIVAVKNR